MKVNIKEYLKARDEEFREAVKNARKLNLNISLVLSAVTGGFYYLHNTYLDNVAESDIIICQFKKSNEVIEDDALPDRLFVEIDGVVDVEVIERNRKKGRIIGIFESEVYEGTRTIIYNEHEAYVDVEFPNPITQEQLDNQYRIAKDYILSNDVSSFAKRLIFEIEVTNRSGTVILPDDEHNYCRCPNCGNEVAGNEWNLFGEHDDKNYCEKCGQALIWKV